MRKKSPTSGNLSPKETAKKRRRAFWMTYSVALTIVHLSVFTVFEFTRKGYAPAAAGFAVILIHILQYISEARDHFIIGHKDILTVYLLEMLLSAPIMLICIGVMSKVYHILLPIAELALGLTASAIITKTSIKEKKKTAKKRDRQ